MKWDADIIKKIRKYLTKVHKKTLGNRWSMKSNNMLAVNGELDFEIFKENVSNNGIDYIPRKGK